MAELSDDENKTRNWFDRTEFNCGAVQFPHSTE